MISTNKIRASVSGLFLSALLATTLISTPSASAGTRRDICATSLYVRDAPAGVVQGTLYRGQSMYVDQYSPSGSYAHGFAYGYVNKWGWVLNGYFC
jgi:hypothetical protein